MRLKELTYSISGYVAHPTKQYEHLKPMFSLTVELADADSVESAKAYALLELKKAFTDFENACKAKLGAQ